MNSQDEENKQIEDLEEHLHYHFKDKSYLISALIHSSYANENATLSIQSNERLEFMGDALLDFVFSIKLYETFPDYSEGEMSRLRARIVCESSLAQAAKKIDLGSYIHIGKGEDSSGGRNRASILADALEAVFGSVYLDDGIQSASDVILYVMQHQLKEAIHGTVQNDYKTELQEELQKNGAVKIVYKVTNSSGPDHDRIFHVDVHCNGQTLGSGIGHAKKEAEQEAAKNAIGNLKKAHHNV